MNRNMRRRRRRRRRRVQDDSMFVYVSGKVGIKNKKKKKVETIQKVASGGLRFTVSKQGKVGLGSVTMQDVISSRRRSNNNNNNNGEGFSITNKAIKLKIPSTIINKMKNK